MTRHDVIAGLVAAAAIKTAKPLGIDIPPSLLARADEVSE